MWAHAVREISMSVCPTPVIPWAPTAVSRWSTTTAVNATLGTEVSYIQTVVD